MELTPYVPRLFRRSKNTLARAAPTYIVLLDDLMDVMQFTLRIAVKARTGLNAHPFPGR